MINFPKIIHNIFFFLQNLTLFWTHTILELTIQISLKHILQRQLHFGRACFRIGKQISMILLPCLGCVVKNIIILLSYNVSELYIFVVITEMIYHFQVL